MNTFEIFKKGILLSKDTKEKDNINVENNKKDTSI